MGSPRSPVRAYVEHRYMVLFVILLISIAAHGLFAQATPVSNPLEWLLGLALLATVLSARKAAHRRVLGAVVAACIAARLTHGLMEHPVPEVLSQVLLAGACLLATWLAIERAFSSGPVDGERLAAALSAYLLMGIAFGAFYWLIEAAFSGSFSGGSVGVFTPAQAIYFSFVTQATLGFGDVVPLLDHSKGLVVVQAMGGQIYLAVLVARLVSLYAAEERG